MPFHQSVGESSEEVQVWHCDPLVVFQPEDGIVYAKRSEVEFTPDLGGFGAAKATTSTVAGWQPEITITDWHDLPNTSIAPYKLRPGRILFGHDSEGIDFVWYIDRAADEFLTGDMTTPQPAVEPVLNE
jgi:hypothetical protein